MIEKGRKATQVDEVSLPSALPDDHPVYMPCSTTL
jgi:hypothetical protein